MAIADDKTIVGVSERAAKARDTISSILERESGPSFGDQMRAATSRFRQNIFDASKPTESADEVFQKRIASEISNPANNYKLLSEAAKTGSTRIQSLLNTFEKFADTPEAMAQLIKAASEDPQEIDESNAATWAAKKAQELGLQSYKGTMAKTQLMYANNKMGQSTSAAGADPFATLQGSPQGGQVDTSSMPLIEVPRGTTLNPPPVSPTSTPQQSFEDMGMSFDEKYPGFRQHIEKISKSPEKLGRDVYQKYIDLINSPKYQERGQELSRIMLSTNRLENAIENSKGKTGRVVGEVWKLVDNDVQYLAALQSKFAPGNREPGSGATSDFDAQQLLLATPGPNNRYEVNKKLVGFYKELVKAEQQQRTDMQRFFTLFGTNENFEGIYLDYVNQNPILDPSKPGSFEKNPNRKDFMTWLKDYTGGNIRTGQKKETQQGDTSKPRVRVDVDGNVIP
ncbi:hypothetical protein EBZ39_07535 [bacterium]|nr:hypothetical protein [bacterium]